MPKNNGKKQYEKDEFGRFTEGNPGGGRPKGSGISITTAIKRELEKRPDGTDKATYLDLLVKRIMKKAIQDGDQQTIKQIWNYVDGLPQQSLDLTSDGEKLQPVLVEFINSGTDENDTNTQ